VEGPEVEVVVDESGSGEEVEEPDGCEKVQAAKTATATTE
jgi:hypothetical protein